MKATLYRVALVLASVAAIAAAGAGSVRAADPSTSPDPLIGGTLSTTGDSVSIESHATMPVAVTFEATAPGVTIDPVSLTLAPGAVGHATISGPLTGKLLAHIVQRGTDVPGDKAAVTLEVGIKPYVPPFDPTPFGVGLLLLAGLGFVTYRVKPWRYRLTRTV